MKIDKRFNQLTPSEYQHILENHKKYTDFNILGIFRSILENEKLSLSQKIEIRDLTMKDFEKTYNFLQLKDPLTYFKLITLGEEMTKADESAVWDNIKKNQEKILKDKKIKHRNFGDYSKHNCGTEWCPYNGIMVKQGSPLAEGVMKFHSDENEYSKELKSQRLKKEKRSFKSKWKNLDDE